jgi:metal-responsive CopG/Arc/MetJ family transcriptional regulator
MVGRKSERMVNITTTLTIPLLEKIDELVHEGKVPSRSHAIREAVRNYLKAFG